MYYLSFDSASNFFSFNRLICSIVFFLSILQNVIATETAQSINSEGYSVQYKQTSYIDTVDITDKNNKSITNLLTHIKDLPELMQTKLVNDYFNRIRNVSDISLWGYKEYWATPNELLMKNGGDCEDFAVAKYYYLVKLGINENMLRLAYVKAYNKASYSIVNHLVLLYFNNKNKKEYVLDNIDKSMSSVSNRNDLSFQFAFNKNNIWSLNENINTIQIKRTGIFHSWKNILNRMQTTSIPVYPK